MRVSRRLRSAAPVLRGLLFSVVLCIAVGSPAQAAAGATTPASSERLAVPQISPAEARDALAVLQDDAKRARLIGTLKTIAAAATVSAPSADAPSSGALPSRTI